MSNNYEDYGYEDNENKVNETNNSSMGKKALIIVLVVIAILIIIYLIKGCTGTKKPVVNNPTETFKYEDALLSAGKLYFENNMEENPTMEGECAEVTLSQLIDKGLVDPDKFNTCNLTSTYVRVCILSNGTKQFTPWLTCSDKNSESEYGPNTEGNLNDVISDSTYVSFMYLPQVLKSSGTALGKVEELWKSDITYTSYKTLATTNYYRYRDKLYTWNLTTNHYYTRNGEKTNAKDVNEYYVSSPSSDYKLYDNATNDAYKWYKSNSTKVYALGSNGAKLFSASAPTGYPHNEGGVDGYYQRTVTGTYSPYKYYVCAVDATSSTVVYQKGVACGQGSNKNMTYQREIMYSCVDTAADPGASVVGTGVAQNSKCNKYSNWAFIGTKKCTVDNITCRTIRVYNWFKYEDDGVKSYYPSGASSASGEKVYYTSAPAAGYVKDTSTKTKAYKWYRTTSKTTTEYTAVAPSGYAKATKTSDYKWSDWTDWSTKNPKVNDGRDRSIETKTKIKLQQIIGATDESWSSLTENDKYVTFDEMITIFKNNKYEVNTLKDISDNGEIRYQTKMLLRNKKENK